MANAQVRTIDRGPRTANERLKTSFNNYFWGSLTAAAVLHFAALAFWPTMTAADYGPRSTELEAIELPPEVEIPPPPEEIPRPLVPVISTDIDIPDDLTIPETTFAENPIDNLPPPPAGTTVDPSAQPVFTPYEVRPEPRNRAQIQRDITRNYPPTLRDAGIGGQVVVWLYIDEQGNVVNTRVQTSSGYPQMDQAAENVLRNATFTPALNRDQRVAVWVAFPVTFSAR
jgi:periplasmic protein TonB